MPDGKCPKCGWKAPEGLLKCPFCKTYIRKPGSSSSQSIPIPDLGDKKPGDKAASSATGSPLPGLAPAPGLPPPPADVVKKVTREISRVLFDDSGELEALPPGEPGGPEDETLPE